MRELYGRRAGWEPLAALFRREAELQAYKSLIRRYFDPADYDHAIRVAWAVSRMDAGAIGVVAPGRMGLFQLLPSEVGLADHEAEWLLNPVRNAAAARNLVDRVGWASFGPLPFPSTAESAEDVEDR